MALTALFFITRCQFEVWHERRWMICNPSRNTCPFICTSINRLTESHCFLILCIHTQICLSSLSNTSLQTASSSVVRMSSYVLNSDKFRYTLMHKFCLVRLKICLNILIFISLVFVIYKTFWQLYNILNINIYTVLYMNVDFLGAGLHGLKHNAYWWISLAAVEEFSWGLTIPWYTSRLVKVAKGHLLKIGLKLLENTNEVCLGLDSLPGCS